MSSVQFLIDFVFNIYLMVVLLRLWLQFARADFYNPFSQFVVKATQPIVAPMRRILPSIGRLDTATFVLALIVAGLKIVTLNVVLGGSGLNIMSVVILSFVIVIKEILTLVMYVLIMRAIMSWVSQGNNPMELVLSQLTEPMLAPIRRRMPEMGGLDLSMMVVIVMLLFIQKLLGDLLAFFNLKVVYPYFLSFSFAVVLLFSSQANAEQKQVLGIWDVHYIALNTTFLSPEVAKQYAIVRSKFNALINISVLDRKDKSAQSVVLTGEAKNLIGVIKKLTFKQVKEGKAIYYLATLPFSDLEQYRISINISNGVEQKTLKFQHKFYAN